MNIFYLDKSPKTSSRMMVNCHVNKMISETAQILSNCYSLDELKYAPPNQSGNPRRHSYPHHPCCKWVQESESNFMWVVEHGIYLYEEKLFRTKVGHFSIDFIKWCKYNVPYFECKELTKPALAMKNYPECMGDDPVESYRKFYVADKQVDKRGRRIDLWTKRRRPDFWWKYADFAKFKDYL